MPDDAVKQFTSLLDNSVLGRLERMRIAPRRKMTNRAHGEHLSGKGGTSIEFSDFRDYVAGDDLRFVDWNIFSRLNRPYVKQFRYEEQMCVVIIIDASSSMKFDGKFERACQLAGAFALMGLFSLEPVSIYACGPSGREPHPRLSIPRRTAGGGRFDDRIGRRSRVATASRTGRRDRAVRFPDVRLAGPSVQPAI
jgi:uncharacterized protein (DUF58 family)